MCRMLGIIGDKSDYSLLADFQKLAVIGKIRAGMEPGHFDGWGMAGFVKGMESYFGRSYKAANKGLEFNQASVKAAKSKTSVLITHIRKATGGLNCLENTHPFIKDGWIFCHNGTIYDAKKLQLEGPEPEGSTDSERFFYFLLNKLRHCDWALHTSLGTGSGRRGNPSPKGTCNDAEVLKTAIEEAVAEIHDNFDYTSLTFLLTNGKVFVAYRDYNENSDEDDQFAGYYTLHLAQKNGFVAVCSEPITNLNFKPLKNKELVII